jgi:adenylate cyclase
VHLRRTSLGLVILVPVIVFLIFAGTGSYSLIVSSVEEFADRTIRQSFGYMTEAVYAIADRELDQLHRAGQTADAKAVRIRQVATLIEIEDFARKNHVGVVVFSTDTADPVLVAGLPATITEVATNIVESSGQRTSLSQGHEYYSEVFEFSPWSWQVVVLKDAEAYDSLLSKARYYYLLTAVALLTIAILLIVYLKRMIANPIQQIVNRFREGKTPNYKGIQDFEFLSDSIGEMMLEVADHRGQLEAQVRERTSELARSVEELEALREVGHAVNSTLDVEKVLATIVARACDLSQAHGGIIYEFDETTEQFHPVATHGISSDRLAEVTSMPIHLKEGAVGAAATTRESIQIEDMGKERTLIAPRVRQVLVELGAHSVIAVPLIRESQVLGCLLIWRHELRRFSDETVTLLQALASQSVLAINNARQAAELTRLNKGLEQKVAEQLAELQRVSQLKRFFSPQLAEVIVSSGDESFMESHRQEIAVVFCDLRQFTEFSSTAEPEEQFRVLREYHNAVGSLIFRFGATLEHFGGDGVMAFFNDPVPCPNPARKAIEMALAMRDEVGNLAEMWSKRGFDLGFGVGIELGYATLGQVGFEGQFHYMAIGSVANLAARLCDRADSGQVLITQRVYSEVEESVEVEPVGELGFKGFQKPIAVFNVLRLEAAVA